MEDLFEGFNPSQYDEEARRKWGTTDAFVESEKRTNATRPMTGRRSRPNRQRCTMRRTRP